MSWWDVCVPLAPAILLRGSATVEAWRCLWSVVRRVGEGLEKLLWFHAFRRDTIAEVFDVLKKGPTPNPNVGCTTRKNERDLAISPSVYAYLGRALEVFGECALVLPRHRLAGSVSPFDSGGLVDHIAPANGWEAEERRTFLTGYTWATEELTSLLATYPGATAVASYLACERPSERGPHALWKGKPEGEIWSAANNDWRAWTWEARCESTFPVGHSLHRWSCTPQHYQQLLDAAASGESWVDGDFLEFLVGKYVRGGVSNLVRELRAEQEAA